jgi:ketosteroid isomerase-like protein
VDPEATKLIALQKTWNQVQMARDASALDGILGERFVGTYSNGNQGRKADFLATMRMSSNRPATVNIQDLNVELYGDAAVVTGIYHVHGIDKGKPYDHEGRFTDTWIRKSGQWECVASPASLIQNRH